MDAWADSAMKIGGTFGFFCQKIDISGQTSEEDFSQEKGLFMQITIIERRMIPSI